MRRRRPVEPETTVAVAPPELLRCPWSRHGSFEPERFGSWLEERRRWRAERRGPLPRLQARDRLLLRDLAAQQLLDPELVDEEERALQGASTMGGRV